MHGIGQTPTRNDNGAAALPSLSEANRDVARTPRVLRHAATGLMALGLLACSGDFHSNRGLDDMVCDSNGCWVCDDGRCEEYNCDATHQCPMQRTCSIDNRCMPDDGSTPTDNCDSHDDCDAGEICTLEGTCVTSPGGGPGNDVATSDTTDDTSDVSTSDVPVGDTTADVGPEDTSTGEVILPEHPDDACLTNSDCGLDGTCVNGGCYFACSAGKCPPGQGCFDGQCRALEVPENMCTFNGECGTEHACLEGTCYNQCAETLDCPAHTRCSGGLCVADTTPVIQCSGPASCTDGKGCVDGKCLTPCENGICGAGFECRFSYCQRTATCFDRADCGGADCVDGTCTEL